MSYGAVEMKDPHHDEEDDPAIDFSHTTDTFTPRALACYQAFLCLVFIVGGSYLVSTYELFEITNHNSALTPLEDSSNSVESFSAAFSVPKGAKKGTPAADPDLVFLLTPSIKEWFGGEEGSWVYSHGELYLLLPTAMLHAVSGGLMDPEMSTTEPPVEKLSGECFIQGGDRLDCLKSLMESQLDENNPPKGGYFAFVTNDKMSIFHYSTEFGVAYTPVEPEDIWHFTMVFVVAVVLTALVGAAGMAGASVYFITHLHEDVLDEYIDKGNFMHDEEHHDMYEGVLHEVHAEHHAEHAEDAEHDPEHQPDVHDDHPAIAKAQKKAKKKLKKQIAETQGVLHLVSHYTHGGKTKKNIESADLAVLAGPSLISQVLSRTMETGAHAALMVITCSPVLIANYMFKEGVQTFGRFGLDSGIIYKGAIVYYFHVFMMFSAIICNILLLSLIFHYISHEFNGEKIPICKLVMQNPISQFMFKSWTGFSYLQGMMLWMSSVMIMIFVISGGMGLVLHLYTNMFKVTALIGIGATMYIQFNFFKVIVDEVHAEIHHANVIMDDLVEALGKRLMHLRLKQGDTHEEPEKHAKRKKKIHDMQKAILTVRSGFSNTLTHELHEHGFGPKEFLIQILGALLGAGVIIGIVYSAMKSAHLFGKAVEAAGSALAGGAMLVMNSSKKEVKKGPPKFPPSVQLAIDNLNVVLQTVVKDSVCDLVYMLRHEGHCQQIVADAIKQAEKEMAEEDKEGSAWAKKNAQAFVKSANDGLKAGLKKVKDHNKEKAEKKAAKKQQSDTKALTTSAPTASAPTKISKPAVDPLDAAFERPYVAEPQVPKLQSGRVIGAVTQTQSQRTPGQTRVLVSASPARSPGGRSISPGKSPKTAVELGRQKIGIQTWVCKMDTKSQKVYYFTIEHKKPQWTAPEGWTVQVALPPGVTLSPPTKASGLKQPGAGGF